MTHARTEPENAWSLAAIRAWWAAHRRAVLPIAIALLVTLALLKLGTELYRLIGDDSFVGAIDLRLRQAEVKRWFAGLPVYTELSRFTYPPQAYVMLWPFTGWLGADAARWLWALTSIAALGWLCSIAARESGAADSLERALAVAMVLSMNAVGVTMGNGQLIVHLLPALVVALLLLRRPDAGWLADVAAAVLLLFALVKPTLSAPFAWAAVMTTRRVRPLALTVVGYVLMTLLAASFQREDAVTLVRQWAGQGGAELGRGYGDVHSILVAAGLEHWAMPLSLVMFAGLGIWTWKRRLADPWILMGVAAIVARLWTYHRLYDDVLILLPMVALFRVAGSRPATGTDDVRAGVLLAIAIAVMAAPARLLGGGASALFIGGHVAVWLAMLFFLARTSMPVAPPPGIRRYTTAAPAD